MDGKPESYAMTRTIAVCQMSPNTPEDLQANTKKVIAWMQKAAKAGADLALFGELVIADYDLRDVNDSSRTNEGAVAVAIANAAMELGIAVIYGYSEVEGDEHYNSLMFIDRYGERLANYRKVHLLPTEAQHYTRGNALTVVDWDGLRIALGVGVDVCMHEYVGAMATNGGARLVVIASAFLDDPRSEKIPFSVVPARALENGSYIAYVSLAGEKYLGMSRVFGPSADCLASVATSEEVLFTAAVPVCTADDDVVNYQQLRRPSIYSETIPYETEQPCRRVTREDVQHFFKHRAQYYDKQMEGVYNGPSVAADALACVVKEKDKKVLDVAAGTGLVGESMFRKGFYNIIALDRSETMLERLAGKNVYAGTILGEFEKEARKLPSGSFHACISVGAFLTAGFLDPAVTVTEMVRLTEVGGFVLLLWNATELNELQCKDTREKLQKALDNVVNHGLCEYVQRVSVPKYLKEHEGYMVIMRKLEME